MPAEAQYASSAVEPNIGAVQQEMEKPAAAEATRRRKQEDDLASAGKKARAEEGVASGDGEETTRVVDDVCVLISQENTTSAAAVDTAEPENVAVDAGGTTTEAHLGSAENMEGAAPVEEGGETESILVSGDKAVSIPIEAGRS